MSFDNSRFTFNPWNDYLGVVMQQGRVQLDSDWNEWLAEFARRIQAGTLDILGLAGVPSTTPYGFHIKASATPDITIGAGRIYVDGLLAENHGPAASAQWDAALAEMSGAPQIPGAPEVNVDYNQQPYLPGANLQAFLSTTPSGGKGPFLVYLDVWQRAVTYLEDVDLVEKAVGVDTTGRLQTVWQVGLVDVSVAAGGPSEVWCSTPDSAIAPWWNLIQPSAEQLTIGVVPAASSGPCALGPATGYTGLENQLYRVEIHACGVYGWNASTPYVLGAEVIDSNGNLEIAVVAGTSGPTAPLWPKTPLGSTVTDGTVTWQLVATGYRSLWVANTAYALGAQVVDSNGNLETAVAAGTSGPTAPAWPTSAGATVSDGTTGLVWQFATPTFKWSRENASVATAVTAITQGGAQLTVQSTGKDAVLGFSPNDWVEITDDWLELNGLPGQLRQVSAVSNTAKTLTLATVVSLSDFPVDSNGQTDPSRHTRLTRWDQGGQILESDGATVWVNLDAVGSTGDIPVPPPGIALILENGITVSFGLNPAGGSFNTGDYWTFAARTADGSVEILTQPPATAWDAAATYAPGQIVTSGGNYYVCLAANSNQAPPNAAYWAAPQVPPFGIQHHYCRLGIVNFNASPPTVGDCRKPFQSLANPCIHVTQVALGSGRQLQNDGTFSIQELASGIQVSCDVPVDPAIITQPPQPATQPPATASPWNATTPYAPGQVVTSGGYYYICLAANTNQTPPNAEFWAVAQFNCPICFVTVDLPFPATPPTPPGGGFNPLTLSATVWVAPSTQINWIPTSAAQAVMASQVSPGAPPSLARLKLKGNCIWAEGNPDVYLNGAVAGVPSTAGGQPITSLQLPTGDGRVSADFDMWFWLTSVPVVTLSTLALNFVNQLVNTTSAPQTVMVTNNGTTALTITASGDFAQTNTCGTSVVSGGTCTISVTFTPTLALPLTGQISIDAGAAGTFVIALTGTGIAPALNVSPTTLSFGSQPVSTTSAPLPVTLTNTGTAAATISIGITGINPGDSPGDYSIQSSSCGSTLAAGTNCTINVQFAPPATGSRTAQLQITQTVPAGPPAIVIPLSGTGTVVVPIKPIEPVVPIKPIGPVEPIEPVKPVVPVEPVEPIRPS